MTVAVSPLPLLLLLLQQQLLLGGLNSTTRLLSHGKLPDPGRPCPPSILEFHRHR